MTKYISDIDEVLTTTRTVRLRLDFSREVESEVVVECLAMAQQASVGSNQEYWRFVLVSDNDQKSKVAKLYREVWNETVEGPLERGEAATVTRLSPDARGTTREQERQARILRGVKYLVDHLELVPIIMVACSCAPTPRRPLGGAASGYYGSIFPFVWSFQLALRSRGIGSVLATAIVHRADELKEILELPAAFVPITMVPLAYTKGTNFKPAFRRPLDEIFRWDRWTTQLDECHDTFGN